MTPTGGSPRETFARRVEAAEAFEVARMWGHAGAAWIEAARVAVAGGALPSGRQTLDRAAEAFRRDDRPHEARRAIETALELGPGGADRAALHARLSGLLPELGLGREALEVGGAALPHATGAWVAVLRDTLAGAALGFARKEVARAHAAALASLGPDGALAHGFRRGQLLRLDGDLDGAADALHAAARALDGRPGGDAGIGAAHAELAEIDLLRGDVPQALAGYEAARARHEAAGRRALALRCLSGRVRAAVEGGLDPLPAPLEGGLAYAADRGLVMLEVDLRIARGMALAVRDPDAAANDLRAALRVAEDRGARLHAGRARLQLALRTPCTDRQRARWLARAVQELEDDAPLAARAREE